MQLKLQVKLESLYIGNDDVRKYTHNVGFSQTLFLVLITFAFINLQLVTKVYFF